MGITKVINDDLDGEPLAMDTEPVSVTFEGTDHPLYLSPENLTKFRSFLAGNNPLLGKTPPSTPKADDKPKVTPDERQQLRDRGFTVSDRGRVSKEALAELEKIRAKQG